LLLNADYDVRRRMYEKGTVNDKSVFRGSGTGTWTVLPNRLWFDLKNVMTETTIDATGQFEPDNRQVTTTTTAGATLRLDSFGNQYVDTAYKYSRGSYEETDSDSQRHIGTVTYVFPLSAARRVQAVGSYSDVDFENPQSPDYRSSAGHLEFISAGGPVDVTVAIGYTEFDRELRREDINGVTGRASVLWQASGVTALTLTYAHSIEDDSTFVLAGLPDLGSEFNENSGLNEAFINDEASAVLTTQLGSNQVSVGAYLRTQDYEDVARDQEASGLKASLTRPLRPTLDASLFAHVSTTTFDSSDQDRDEWSAGAELTWSIWRRLSLSLAGGYAGSESDAPTGEFDEWRAIVTVNYSLLE
jgi:hypothetical protein